MTVAQDLATSTGIKRRLFVKIDGFEPILWQEEAIAGYSRSGVVCLQPGIEMSTTFDVGEMWQSLDAITFNLLDIKTSTGISYFGQLFAPGRWDDNLHWRVAFSTSPKQQINASQTTIELENTIDLSESGGTLYIGNETITYGSINSDKKTIAGVTKGKYSCTDIGAGGNYGYCYKQPRSTDAQPSMAVGAVPFSWHGRRIALYCSTYNPATGWNSEANAQLLWIGRLTNTINFDPSSNCWQLSCTSILTELEEKEVATDLKEMTLAPIINLGANATQFVIVATLYEKIASVETYYRYCKVSLGAIAGDIGAVTRTLNNYFRLTAVWYDEDDNVATGYVPEIYFGAEWEDDGKIKFYVKLSKYLVDSQKEVLEIYGGKNVNEHAPNYLFDALGYERALGPMPVTLTANWPGHSSSSFLYRGENPVSVGYQIVDQTLSSNKIYTKEIINELITDQGDYLTQVAYFYSNKATAKYQAGDDDVTAYFAYSSFTTETITDIFWITGSYSDKTYGVYTLVNSRLMLPSGMILSYDNINEPIKLKQCYVPKEKTALSDTVGPYEMLLKILSSTGQSSYNGTYDKYPIDFGVGIESSLIDSQSFLEADMDLRYHPLAWRYWYVFDEPVTVKELFQREAKLFGKALTWRNGKLRITDVLSNPTDDWIVQLDDSNQSTPDEKITLEISSDTVINKYNFKGIMHHYKRKYIDEIVINDTDSISSCIAKSIDIEHPGIFPSANTLDNLYEVLCNQFRDRFYRYPSPIISRTISPVVLNQIEAGDKVKISSSYMHDPYGSGSQSTNCYAIVLNINRNYEKWTGQATLLLLTRYKFSGEPWAPSALANYSHDTNGWNAACQRLYLMDTAYFGNSSTDSDDGAAFLTGQKVMVYVRDCDQPSNILNVEKWGPYTIASTYETDGDGVLTLSDANTGVTNLPDFSNVKEYVITYADYGDSYLITNMLNSAIWQASTTTTKIGSFLVIDDHLDDSVESFTEDSGNGTIVETTYLNILCPANTNCAWSNAPIAYYDIPSVDTSAPTLIQHFIGRMGDQYGDENFNSGMSLYINRDNAYWIWFRDYPTWVQNCGVSKVVTGVSTSGLASINTGITPTGSTPIFFHIKTNPTNQETNFYYSTSGTVDTMTKLYNCTLEFTPTRVGLFSKVWSTWPTVETGANFQCLREFEETVSTNSSYPISYYRWK